MFRMFCYFWHHVPKLFIQIIGLHLLRNKLWYFCRRPRHCQSEKKLLYFKCLFQLWTLNFYYNYVCLIIIYGSLKKVIVFLKSKIYENASFFFSQSPYYLFQVITFMKKNKQNILINCRFIKLNKGTVITALNINQPLSFNL